MFVLTPNYFGGYSGLFLLFVDTGGFANIESENYYYVFWDDNLAYFCGVEFELFN